VSLAPLRDPELILPVVATSLGIEPDREARIPDRIARHLGENPHLLVLDNCEHLPVAPAIAELLEACPSLKMLATSRTPLPASGESIFAVPPLALADPEHLPPLSELARIDAVALFVERAHAADPDFDLTAHNAEVVAAICARLDGLPLAIELAAVRLQVLSPAALLARLSHRLDLLTRGRGNLPERHRTLRSTIAWSYDQLQEPDQRAFQRLAVFADGCDLAAAEYVVDDDVNRPPKAGQTAGPRHPTMDALSELLDNALIKREVVAGEPRFTMLETIREYALERLEASGGATLAHKRHAEYFAALAEEAEPALSIGLLEGNWPHRLEHDHANLRAALGWSLDQEDPGIGLRLAAALDWFWWIRGHLVEGSAWLERALMRSREDESALRSKLLDGAGSHARSRGEIERAAALHNASLGIATRLEDGVAKTRALANLGMVADARNEIEDAITLFERALGLARTSRQAEVLASILTNYGLIKLTNGDQRQGVVLLEEGLIIARHLGPSGLLGAILSNLGDAQLEQGDQSAATVMYRECLALQSELGNQRGIADALFGIATIAVDGGDLRFATGLLASAHALYGAIKATLPPATARQFDKTLDRVKGEMSETAFAAAWEAGRGADLPSVIAEALHFKIRPPGDSASPLPPHPAYRGLTPREIAVLRLLAQGSSNREIADVLFISPQTAATHVKRILAKIGVSTRTAAAAHAHRHGLD